MMLRSLCRMRTGATCVGVCRPFVQRYAILLANGRGAYQPLDADCMEQRELAETVRKLLQAAKLDGWQVHILASVACPGLGVLS